WRRTTPGFAYEEYNRAHEIAFDSGVVVHASAAPAFRGDEDRVDPEEMLVAALSNCHMLTFLALCAKKRLVVDSYEDRAVGVMTKNEAGKLWVSRVDLHPKIAFAQGTAVDAAALEALHHRAHEECFIANSVKTEIVVHQ
ncbi:MAG: OsmC family protein, partial [Parvularculaceae bacterium]|nr:OsmC family protein [Parvularculaceae bacterium]